MGLSSLSLVVMLVATGCNSSPAPAEAEKPSPAPVAPNKHALGAPLGQSPKVALSELMNAPERFESQTVRVEGDVKRACSRKGCWMELSEAGAPAACRVTFKDYGFFVPTDAAGSKALVEASVQSKVVKASQVAHLEEEGAKFANKAPDGSAREVRLVATGVELWR